MINPALTVKRIADDIAASIQMTTDTWEAETSELERARLQGHAGALLELIMAIDPDRGEMLQADWTSRTTSQKWTDDVPAGVRCAKCSDDAVSYEGQYKGRSVYMCLECSIWFDDQGDQYVTRPPVE